MYNVVKVFNAPKNSENKEEFDIEYLNSTYCITVPCKGRVHQSDKFGSYDANSSVLRNCNLLI